MTFLTAFAAVAAFYHLARKYLGTLPLAAAAHVVPRVPAADLRRLLLQPERHPLPRDLRRRGADVVSSSSGGSSGVGAATRAGVRPVHRDAHRRDLPRGRHAAVRSGAAAVVEPHLTKAGRAACAVRCRRRPADRSLLARALAQPGRRAAEGHPVPPRDRFIEPVQQDAVTERSRRT